MGKIWSSLEGSGQVWIGFSRLAVNTSLYAYHPLSLRMIVLKSLSRPFSVLTFLNFVFSVTSVAI